MNLATYESSYICSSVLIVLILQLLHLSDAESACNRVYILFQDRSVLSFVAEFERVSCLQV